MTCHIEELITRHFELWPECSQIFLDQPKREFIVARRDRCMCCENILCACFFKRLFESVARFNQFTGALKREEGGVALVHMPDGRVISQRTQGAHSAHAQQKFLHDAAVEVRPIQTRGQLFIGIRIRVQV
jgi:hypothetical protein